MNLDPGARLIVDRLRAHGHQVLLAGGCVRDWLLGRQPQDWDLVTDATPEQVRSLFPRTVAVGARFGITVVLQDGRPYEVARFREDGPYQDGRRPASVTPADPRADALRRDFTVNAMFMEPQTGQVLDFAGGRADLRQRLIRAVGDPELRFAEDHLRMLRAVRFAAALDFTIEPATRQAIAVHAPRIAAISAERVCAELSAVLVGPRPGRGLRLLDATGLLAPLLPEVAALRGVEQPPEYHPEGDVWTHTVRTVQFLEEPSLALAWAALLHDIGKPDTQTRTDRIRFHLHETIGAGIAGRIAARLRLSRDQTADIVRLVAEHMRLRHAGQMRPGRLRRLLRQPHAVDLLELHRADCLASHGDLSIHALCRAEMAAADAADPAHPRLLSGVDLRRLGFWPGPAFRRILEAVEEAQLEGAIADAAQAERFVLARFAARHGEDAAPEPQPGGAGGRGASQSGGGGGQPT